jgi:glycosyltransferase involved in cell wall biosynthesis
MKTSITHHQEEIHPIYLPQFTPARIIEIELDRSISSISARVEATGRLYERALCVVRLHGHLLGTVEFQFDDQGVSASSCARHIWLALQKQINDHLQGDALPTVTGLDENGLSAFDIPACVEGRARFLAHAPFVTIIVPTHNRAASLQHCIDSLLQIRYPHYEIIVVDNAPTDTLTADLLHQRYGHLPHVRYLREERAGPSHARNCGLAAATGEFVAFTDDDVVVDRYWLAELMRGFNRADDVVCVSGYLMPLELETPAQYWCEENRGCPWFQSTRTSTTWPICRVYDQATRHTHLYRIGLLGCGASMAVKTSFLRAIKGFDPAMGGRGMSRCGQDIAVLFNGIVYGHKVVFEPASLAYHLHRRDYPHLYRQFHNYGVGLTAYITKNILEHPSLILDLVTKVPYGLLSGGFSRHAKKSPHYPQELNGVQVKGMLYGPLAYLQSCWVERQARRELAYLQCYTTHKDML